MANVWQQFVILRMGKLQSVKGAGLFLIIPLLDNVVAIIDNRIQTTGFNAEQALTKDTVPVNVDAIIFWHVHDAEKAALAITNYREAIDRVAQTSLREMIGSSMLAALLSDRREADEQLKLEIGQKTAPWGISVSSVEIRDVAIPVALQDAMSRQAQAEREKQARVILGSAEATAIYAGHPWALQLRAMNIIYETTKERGATILMPSSMVDSLNPGGAALTPALAGQTIAAPDSVPVPPAQQQARRNVQIRHDTAANRPGLRKRNAKTRSASLPSTTAPVSTSCRSTDSGRSTTVIPSCSPATPPPAPVRSE
jgi:hypothetical protein